MMPPPPSNNLDLRIILETPLRQFVPWLGTVLLVTWAGYPGVICVTPLAWLIALRVGTLYVSRSRNASSRRRIQEAALAGACFGLLQGLLFWVIAPRLGPVQASEETSATVLTVFMLIVGMFSGAGCSLFTAYQFERRRGEGS
jgi:hypothetical protein